MHNSVDLFFTFRRGSAIRALACLCVLMLSVFLLAGCEDGDGDGNGDGTDAVTAVAYTCTNGTADSGTTTAANTERCTECNEGFSLSGTVCVTPYICTNGMADSGTTTAANTERCDACSFGYRLDNSMRTCGAVLELEFTITDTATLELDEAWEVTTAVIGGTTYLFVAGFEDDGVSVFSVAGDGELIVADSVDDSEDVNLELDGALAVTTAVVGGTTYLFAGGNKDDGVSVFSVADGTDAFMDGGTALDGGTLTSVYNVGGRRH